MELALHELHSTEPLSASSTVEDLLESPYVPKDGLPRRKIGFLETRKQIILAKGFIWLMMVQCISSVLDLNLRTPTDSQLNEIETHQFATPFTFLDFFLPSLE